MNRLLIILLAGLALGGCAFLPDNSSRSHSHALTGNWQESNFREIVREQDIHRDKTGVYLLTDGLDAFAARAGLVSLAKTSLDVQYYLYHDDLTGNLLTYLLYKVAERGVRVRILVDDMGLEGRDGGIRFLDSHPNIEIRIFNPFSRYSLRLFQYVSRFGSVTRRMHNKSLTADNLMTIVGGRNIGDEYFSANPVVEFGDLDILATGKVVRQVSNSFDQYWNSELSYPIAVLSPGKVEEDASARFSDWNSGVEALIQDSEYLDRVNNSELVTAIKEGEVKFEWVDARVFADSPEKILITERQDKLSLLSDIGKILEDTSKELIIVSPYFVPGKGGVEFFRRMVEKGVQVIVLTNSLASNDVSIVHGGYAKYRRDMIRAGVKLYELNVAPSKEKKKVAGASRASLHAKTFIIDRKSIFIGSLNLDPRSVYENTEIGVGFNSPYFGRMISTGVEQEILKKAFRVELYEENGYQGMKWTTLRKGRPIVFTTEPYTSFWQRLGVWLLSLLPVESQL